MKKEGLVRLSYIEGKPVQVGKTTITVTSHLPNAISLEHLGIDLNRTAMRCRVADIDELHIVGSSDRRTARHTPNVTGMSGDGSATVGLSSHSEKYKPFSTRADGKTGYIMMNLQDMQEEVGRRDNNRIRSPEVWASVLNETVEKGINEVGQERLLERGDVFVDIFIHQFSGIMQDSLTVNGRNIPFVIYAAMWGLLSSYSMVAARIIKNDDFDAFYRMPVERAVALKVMTSKDRLTHKQHLIRALD